MDAVFGGHSGKGRIGLSLGQFFIQPRRQAGTSTLDDRLFWLALFPDFLLSQLGGRVACGGSSGNHWQTSIVCNGTLSTFELYFEPFAKFLNGENDPRITFSAESPNHALHAMNG